MNKEILANIKTAAHIVAVFIFCILLCITAFSHFVLNPRQCAAGVSICAKTPLSTPEKFYNSFTNMFVEKPLIKNDFFVRNEKNLIPIRTPAAIYKTGGYDHNYKSSSNNTHTTTAKEFTIACSLPECNLVLSSSESATFQAMGEILSFNLPHTPTALLFRAVLWDESSITLSSSAQAQLYLNNTKVDKVSLDLVSDSDLLEIKSTSSPANRVIVVNKVPMHSNVRIAVPLLLIVMSTVMTVGYWILFGMFRFKKLSKMKRNFGVIKNDSSKEEFKIYCEKFATLLSYNTPDVKDKVWVIDWINDAGFFKHLQRHYTSSQAVDVLKEILLNAHNQLRDEDLVYTITYGSFKIDNPLHLSWFLQAVSVFRENKISTTSYCLNSLAQSKEFLIHLAKSCCRPATSGDLSALEAVYTWQSDAIESSYFTSEALHCIPKQYHQQYIALLPQAALNQAYKRALFALCNSDTILVQNLDLITCEIENRLLSKTIAPSNQTLSVARRHKI